MTAVTLTQPGRGTLCVRRRSEAEVLIEQVRGIEAWTREHRDRVLDVGSGASREARLDLARRREAYVRQREALRDWTARRLQADCEPMHCRASTRAVLAHRNAWFKDKVAGVLRDAGIDVVAELENGADAVGLVVAEQPDLLLLEDKLPMVSGIDLVRAACRYAPSTLVVVQVEEDRGIGPFLDAGAAMVYSRRIPPADLASDAIAVLASEPASHRSSRE
jgi:CheY-like chemotaxis protein